MIGHAGIRRRLGARNVLLGLWVVRVVSALVAATLLIACGYGFVTFRTFDRGLHRLTLDTGVRPAAPTVGTASAVPQPVKTDVDGTDQNILVVGNDDRSDMTDKEVRELGTGRDGGSVNTDTMMIVHAPADGSTATLISFPRDSYVDIPGYGMNRLNAAYTLGYQNSSGGTDAKRAAGANLLIKTISKLTGLTIDHFVQIGLLGFYRISNAIGGVPINLCNAVDDPLYSHLVMSAGKHRIRGVQALEFVRQRHGLTNGDLDRVKRQRYFITAAFRQITSAGVLFNPGKLDALVSAIDESIYVDSGFRPLKFAAQVAALNPNNIVGQTIPKVRFDKVNGSDVNIVNPAAVKDFVTKVIDGTDGRPKRATPVRKRPARPIDAGCIN